MVGDNFGKYLVAIIGAGPAGLFASRLLATSDIHVTLLNRDIIPGGLAEYGIYYDKYKMKEGLRKQFQQILGLPNIDYFGNVKVGEKGDFRLPDLRRDRFSGNISDRRRTRDQVARSAWRKSSRGLSCQRPGVSLQFTAALQ